MATFRSFTTSWHDGQIIDEKGVRELIDNYTISSNIEIEDGRVNVWGYCWFEATNKNSEEVCTEEFLFRLSEMISGELKIKSIGHMELRSVDGQMWMISDGDVYTSTLEDNKRKIPSPM